MTEELEGRQEKRIGSKSEKTRSQAGEGRGTREGLVKWGDLTGNTGDEGDVLEKT